MSRPRSLAVRGPLPVIDYPLAPFLDGNPNVGVEPGGVSAGREPAPTNVHFNVSCGVHHIPYRGLRGLNSPEAPRTRYTRSHTMLEVHYRSPMSSINIHDAQVSHAFIVGPFVIFPRSLTR